MPTSISKEQIRAWEVERAYLAARMSRNPAEIAVAEKAFCSLCARGGRRGGSLAGDLAAIDALLRGEAQPRRGHNIAGMARDLERIANATPMCGKRAAQPAAGRCEWCGAPADFGNECDDCAEG